jgi:CDP-paratose 2-epimerase
VLHPADDWRSNVDATRVLLEALRQRPIPTAVLSSVKPYRVPPYRESWGGLTEDCPLYSDEPYAASKASQVHLCTSYATSYDLPVVAFRCSNLVAGAPCHGPRHGAWTWLCISAAIGRPLEIQGDGTQTRDLLNGNDVATACMAAIENAARLKGRVFNIGGGASNRLSILDAATRLHEWSGTPVTYAPRRRMDDDHVFACYAAFLRETGWRPLVSADQTIECVYHWACDNRDELRALYA